MDPWTAAPIPSPFPPLSPAAPRGRAAVGLGWAGLACGVLVLLASVAAPAHVSAPVIVLGGIGCALVIAGLRVTRAGGDGTAARRLLAQWFAGYLFALVVLLALAAGFALQAGAPDVIIVVLVALLALGGLGGSVVVARARVLAGWCRWTPVVLLVGQSMTLTTTFWGGSLWATLPLHALGIIAVGAALVTHRPADRP